MSRYIPDDVEREVEDYLVKLRFYGVSDEAVLEVIKQLCRGFYLQGIIYGAAIFDDEWSEDGPGTESEIEVPDVIRDIFGAYL